MLARIGETHTPTASIRPVPFRGGGFQIRSLKIIPPIVFLLLIGLWEIGCRTGVISSLALPAPSRVWEALVELYQSGLLRQHLQASLTRLLVGWSLGVVAGSAIGLAIGLFSIARAGLLPLVSAIFPVPKIALLPLFVIWFGIGEGSKIATILFGVFFPMVIATYGGVDNVDRNLIRMGQSFGLPWRSIVWKIIVPGALPAIFSGVRISASIGIILLVAAEMIGAEHGIGAHILLAGAIFSTEQLIAGVAILSMIGLLASALISAAEKRLLDWRR